MLKGRGWRVCKVESDLLLLHRRHDSRVKRDLPWESNKSISLDHLFGYSRSYQIQNGIKISSISATKVIFDRSNSYIHVELDHTNSMPRPSTIADDVATQTITLYANLPQHGKPIIRSNGVPEWTILSAIHLYDKLNEKLVPISIGSGVKVLPASRLPPLGDTVHDCHAEILARRGLVQWCIEEAGRVASGEGGGGGGGLMVRDGGKFRLKDGVEVWMYVSALPVSNLRCCRRKADPSSVETHRLCTPQHTSRSKWLN